ncbi:hypothetical protein HU200_055480 [Digitaria exilis]|uniref:Uncharacterized protein n=1 Tax=Digitaria exilis TaxID=1010633 RepID=A0A835E5N4_9POAL|nr:hypothetical protein HU200_055480 [Digitaria exilis]
MKLLQICSRRLLRL